MSTISLYQRFTDLFDLDELHWILSTILDHRSVVKLCNTCGITYAGMRTKSVPIQKLALDLILKFFEYPAEGEVIIKRLAKTTSRERADLRRKGIADVMAMMLNGKSKDEAHLSRMIVAMALDERREAHKAALLMLEHAAPWINAMEEEEEEEAADPEAPILEAPSSSAAVGDEVPAAASAADSREERQRLDGALQAAREECRRISQHTAHLEKRVERLRERNKTLQTDSDALRRENNEMQKKLAENDREIQRLIREQADTPAMQAQIHRLERDNRKLSYELQKQRQSTGPAIDLNPVLRTFETNLSDIKGAVQSTVEAIREEHVGLKRTINDLQKEVHTLRVEAQRTREPAAPRRPPKAGLERVGIFVDVQNMFYAARQYDGRLDFEKLMEAAVGDRRMIRAIAYVIQTPEVDQSGFVAMLQQRSYQVKPKDLRLRSDGSAKGDWDMGMAIDMISMADKLDVVVLVSGDGDFVALVNLLKEIGPRVEVFSFPHNTARDLMEVADRYYPIDEALLIKMDKGMNGEDRTVSTQPEEIARGPGEA